MQFFFNVISDSCGTVGLSGAIRDVIDELVDVGGVLAADGVEFGRDHFERVVLFLVYPHYLLPHAFGGEHADQSEHGLLHIEE